MEASLTLFGIVAIAFASTNMDNLLLLIGWQLGGGITPRRLLVGYLFGMCGVLCLAILLGLAGNVIPLAYLGYLGIIPVLVGLRLLFVNLKSPAESATALPDGGAVAAVATTQLSNGVDTILVFAPLLADSRLLFDIEIALLFVLLTGIWFVLARFGGVHVSRIRMLERAGRWLAPLVMILVGIYIFSNTATDLS